ncbi:MAG: metal ABC transporter substrate-binding protein [Rickettsiaceae bacterium]|nr:metal ABC transporter substrate-binding protein [Rickettsiaceae bacterium]
MIKKSLIIFILLFSNNICTNAFAATPKKVIVSIYPLASMVKMILGDSANVEVLQQTASCPHHFSLSPSRVKLIKNADYLILIDKQFEDYLSKYQESSRANIIQITELINFDRSGSSNYHFWTNIDYIKKILAGLKDYFIEQNFDKREITRNYNESIDRVNQIKTQNLEYSLIIGESLKYLPSNGDYVEKIYGMKSLKNIKQMMNRKRYKCVVLDNENLVNLNSKIASIVRIDIEDWDIGDVDLEDYLFEYLENINQKLSVCHK